MDTEQPPTPPDIFQRFCQLDTADDGWTTSWQVHFFEKTI